MKKMAGMLFSGAAEVSDGAFLSPPSVLHVVRH